MASRTIRRPSAFTTRHSDGFTLVELLTVIGIIAVLAAILFPVFATVRGKARQTACQSNLRQIGMAFQMYAQDYDALLPYGKDASDRFVSQMWDFSPCKPKILAMPMLHRFPDPQGSQNFREGIVDSYLKSAELWKCAGDTGFSVLDNNDSCNGPCAMPSNPSMYEVHGASYLFRTGLALSQTNVDTLEGRTFDGQTIGPSGFNMLFDGNGSWHGSPFALGKSGLRYVTLYVDGHAKLLTNDEYQRAWGASINGANANPCP